MYDLRNIQYRDSKDDKLSPINDKVTSPPYKEEKPIN